MSKKFKNQIIQMLKSVDSIESARIVVYGNKKYRIMKIKVINQSRLELTAFKKNENQLSEMINQSLKENKVATQSNLIEANLKESDFNLLDLRLEILNYINWYPISFDYTKEKTEQ